MPIARREFDAGGENFGKVLRFLRENSESAFTITELLRTFEAEAIELDELDLLLHLGVDQELIEAKLIGLKVYYACPRSLGF